MKIILHIGQSKTGTSAIQGFMTLNRKVLLENKVLYPMPYIKGMQVNLGSHNAFVDALTGKNVYPYLSAEEYFKQFLEQAEQFDSEVMILSAEHFFGGEPRIWETHNVQEYETKYRRKLQKLAKLLQGHEVHVLVYLRHPVKWFLSAVSQTIRIERLISKKRVYLNDNQFFELMKPLLNYSFILQVWRDTIKPKNMTLIPYEKSQLYGGSSVSDFLMRINLDHLDFKYSDNKLIVNSSLNLDLIEVKKILNRVPRNINQERLIINCMEKLSKKYPQKSEYSLNPFVFEKLIVASMEQCKELELFCGKEFFGTSIDFVNEKPVTKQELLQSIRQFKSEISHVNYWLLYLKFKVMSFFRGRLKPLHALLHQVRLIFWYIKYKK